MPIALANAYLDSVPFLAVTGNVPTSQFNRGAFQEMYRHYQADFPSTVRAYCKRVYQPTRGEMVPLAVRQAWKTMVTGRPGPVVLDVPFDIFKEAAAEETPNPQEWNANISCRCGADPEGVAKRSTCCWMRSARSSSSARASDTAARRPSCCDSRNACRSRSQRRRAAWARSTRDHPLALGLVARNGHYQANHATRQADVLLALGVRFDDRTSSSWIPGLFLHHPADEADPRRYRSGRDRAQLPGRARPDGGCAHLPAPGAGRARPSHRTRPGSSSARHVARTTIDGYRKEWDRLVAPGFTRR